MSVNVCTADGDRSCSWCGVLSRATDLSCRKQPELQPQVANYSRATSKSYLKQTEALWFCMNLSRQEGEYA